MAYENVNNIYEFDKEKEYIKYHVKLTDVIREYMKIEKTADGVKALCPFHHEKTPSFFVTEENQLYCCQGCGAGGDIFKFLMHMHNLSFKEVKDFIKKKFLPPNIEMRNFTPPLSVPKIDRKAVNQRDYDNIPEFNAAKVYNIKNDRYVKLFDKEIYTYKYRDGSIAGYKVFFTDKTGKKQVIPVTLYNKPKTGLVWAMTGFSDPSPLFNIEEVLSNTNKPVLLVEGERCATIARSLLSNFVVTTWAGGSNAVNQTDWSILEKHEVFIWPDNDDGGRNAAELIASQLHNVEIIKTDPNKPKGYDIADEIKTGKTEEFLTEFILSHRVPGKRIESSYKSFENPGGLLGRIVRHILAASPVEQPNLAIGAALSLMSVLQAQKWCTEDYICPNLYIMGLGKSAGGKSFPLVATRQLVSHLRHVRKLRGGMPISAAGLVTSLHKKQGRMICLIDEFGEEFKSMMSKEAPDYRKGIMKTMMMLFSDANDEFHDGELADRDKTKNTWIIRKPHLTFYGTTVPKTFYESLNMDSSVNGFLARLLVIDDMDPDPVRKEAKDVVRTIPEELLNELEILGFNPENELIAENDPDEYNFTLIPVPYMHEARKLMQEYRDECRKIILATDDDDQFKQSIYGRCFEIASKLALLARTDMRVIDKEAVVWAIDIVRRCTENYYTKARGFIHDSMFAKKSKEVENYLKKKQTWVSATDLHNRFRMPTKEMHVIIDYLAKSAIIHVKAFQKRNKNKILTRHTTSYRYNFSKDEFENKQKQNL